MLGDGVEGLLQDGAHVLQPGFQEYRRLYPLYLQLDASEPCVDPHREPNQVGKLRQYRDMRLEIVNLEVDPVDLKFGDIEQHVWLPAVSCAIRR